MHNLYIVEICRNGPVSTGSFTSKQLAPEDARYTVIQGHWNWYQKAHMLLPISS